MNSVICFVLIVVSCVAAQDKYTTKYDDVNLDQILQNDRLLKSYVNCLLSKGTCTPDGTELKKVLPDALSDGCSKCNEKQKTGSRRVLTFLIENKPEMYAELEKVYDPSGEYKTKYCQVAKDEGLTVKVCQ